MIALKRNSKESLAIDWVRFPLAALIVLIHTPFTDDRSDFAFYLGKAVSENLADIAVPTFFFISGYLFFAHYEKFGWNEYRNMLIKKSCTLLLPYIIWNAIVYLFLMISHLHTDGTFGDIMPWELHKIFWAQNDGYVATSLFGYKFSILCTPVCGVLWFIRDLMVAMLMSPIIWWIVRRCKLWALILFLIPWVLYIGIPIKGFGLMALCFFPLGATFSICDKDIFKYIRPGGAIISIIFVIIWSINSFISFNSNVPRLLNQLLILTGLVSILYISYICTSCKSYRIICKLGEASFFIYVCHTLFVFYPLHYILDPLETIPYIGDSLIYVLSFLIKLGICTVGYFILKNLCPSLLSIAVGGRVNAAKAKNK